MGLPSSDPIVTDDGIAESQLQENHAVSRTLLIEVALDPSATCRFDSAHSHVETYLRDNYRSLSVSQKIYDFEDYMTFLRHNVQCIHVLEVIGSSDEIIRLDCTRLDIHIYQLKHSTAEQFENESGDSSGEERAHFGTCIDLPSKSLEGLWETLIYDTNLKSRLLQYFSGLLYFSDHGVDPHIVTSHRLILLHGPPGSGKTSLCRALAQKMSIRLSQRFSAAKLVEVSAATLFSRYFSESAKLVQSLFDKIYNMAQEEETLLCVLIDEVETLTSARRSAVSGSDPGDAMRVVNVLLTQLDKLKSRRNVLVMTTSNMMEASDSAFLDRADLIEYIGHPSVAAIYEILQSCILELVRAGILVLQDHHHEKEEATSTASLVTRQSYSAARILSRGNDDSWTSKLLDLCDQIDSVQTRDGATTSGDVGKATRDEELGMSDKTKGQLSGRSLRRLPLLAYTRLIQECNPAPVSIAALLHALMEMSS